MYTSIFWTFKVRNISLPADIWSHIGVMECEISWEVCVYIFRSRKYRYLRHHTKLLCWVPKGCLMTFIHSWQSYTLGEYMRCLQMEEQKSLTSCTQIYLHYELFNLWNLYQKRNWSVFRSKFFFFLRKLRKIFSIH